MSKYATASPGSARWAGVGIESQSREVPHTPWAAIGSGGREIGDEIQTWEMNDRQACRGRHKGRRSSGAADPIQRVRGNWTVMNAGHLNGKTLGSRRDCCSLAGIGLICVVFDHRNADYRRGSFCHSPPSIVHHWRMVVTLLCVRRENCPEGAKWFFPESDSQ